MLVTLASAVMSKSEHYGIKNILEYFIFYFKAKFRHITILYTCNVLTLVSVFYRVVLQLEGIVRNIFGKYTYLLSC